MHAAMNFIEFSNKIMLITGSDHKGALISAHFKISQSQLCMQFFLFKYHHTYLDCMTSMEHAELRNDHSWSGKLYQVQLLHDFMQTKS